MNMANECIAHDKQVRRQIVEFYDHIWTWHEQNTPRILKPRTNEPGITCQGIDTDHLRRSTDGTPFAWMSYKLTIPPTADKNYIVGSVTFLRCEGKAGQGNAKWRPAPACPALAEHALDGTPQVLEARFVFSSHPQLAYRALIVVFVYDSLSDTIIVLDAAEMEPMFTDQVPK